MYLFGARVHKPTLIHRLPIIILQTTFIPRFWRAEKSFGLSDNKKVAVIDGRIYKMALAESRRFSRLVVFNT